MIRVQRRWLPHVRKGLFSVIMLPDGDFLKRCTYVPFFLILTIQGNLRFAETVA